jgi:hypothetical protein
MPEAGMKNFGSTTWHFFRRELENELWCAVPAHHALPHFLLSGEWCFSGHRRGGDDLPPGFDDDAAAVAEHFNGFYLFQLIDIPEPGQQPRPA